MDLLKTIVVAFVAWLKGFLDGAAAERRKQEKAVTAAEDIALRERAKAEALDHDELAKEIGKWTWPRQR